MPILHICRGLPGSGKTYWATGWVAADRARRARVNRDDLRAMADDGAFVKGVTERRVIFLRDAAIGTLLGQGLDVVCDDTNLRQRVVADLARLAARAGAGVELHDFTTVPVEVCVERDAARNRQVGEETIRDLHNRFLRGRTLPLAPPDGFGDVPVPPAPYEPKPGTPKAVLVDIDGTVALMAGRSPFDESRVAEDRPNEPVISVVRAMSRTGHRVVFLSGRTDGCREATGEWLAAHVQVPYDGPFMRAAGDTRKDSIVKAELFDRHVRDSYDVVCVLDDRQQVVDAWRAIGLTVLQVAEGDF